MTQGANFRTKKLCNEVNEYLVKKIKEYLHEPLDTPLSRRAEPVFNNMVVNLTDLFHSNMRGLHDIDSKKAHITVELLQKMGDEKLQEWIKLSKEHKPLPAEPDFKPVMVRDKKKWSEKNGQSNSNKDNGRII